MRLSPLLLALASCRGCPSPGPADAAPGDGSAAQSIAVVVNGTATPTTVYASFGANSQVIGWPFCAPLDAAVGCSFPLAPGASQLLPTGAEAANVTLAFDRYPACDVTLAEFNFNIPGWVGDTANISLVNGWSNDVEIDVIGEKALGLGPTQGPDANAPVFGVYPNGCDICVARQQPPCGIAPCGSSPDDGGQGCGCKVGGQYDPTVPCQASFARGALVTVALVKH